MPTFTVYGPGSWRNPPKTGRKRSDVTHLPCRVRLSFAVKSVTTSAREETATTVSSARADEKRAARAPLGRSGGGRARRAPCRRVFVRPGGRKVGARAVNPPARAQRALAGDLRDLLDHSTRATIHHSPRARARRPTVSAMRRTRASRGSAASRPVRSAALRKRYRTVFGCTNKV